MIVLCLRTLVSSLVSLVITTGFSRVTDVFGSQAQYLWIANSFIFPSSVFIGRTEVAKGLPDAAY